MSELVRRLSGPLDALRAALRRRRAAYDADLAAGSLLDRMIEAVYPEEDRQCPS